MPYNIDPCYEYYVTAIYSDDHIIESNRVLACITGLGTAEGSVTALLTANPIEGATINFFSETGGENYTATTDATGYYSMDLLEDSYSILVEAVGYISQDISNYIVNYNGVHSQDFQLDEFPYAPAVVFAAENDENSVGLYYSPDLVNQWLVYDNDQMTFGGIGAESYDYSLTWASKFTPEDLLDYADAFVTKVAVYQGALVGDYLTEVRILSGDGSNILYAQDVTGELMDNSWNTIDLDDAVPFDHMENLWVAMYVERPGGTYNEPIGGALNPELSERYDYFAYNGAEWNSLSAEYGITDAAWMLRCFVSGTNTGKEVALDQGDYKTTDHKDYSKAASIPTGNGMIATSIQNEKFPLKKPSSSKELQGYNIYRVDLLNNSDIEFIGYTPSVIFTDNGWGSLNWGTYKWAVEAVYTNNVSEMTFSNVLEKDMETPLTINITTNSGDNPVDIFIHFTNHTEPGQGYDYSLQTDNSGVIYIPDFRVGNYHIFIHKVGFQAITIANLLIESEITLNYIIEESIIPPFNLYVNPLGHANWSPVDKFQSYYYDFNEESDLDGWTIIDNGTTDDTWYWTVSDAGNTLDGTAFMFVDSDAAGPGNLLNEYIVSPVIEYTNQTNQLILEFDQYFNNFTGNEFADVDVDDGNDWVTVLAMKGADFGSWASPDHQIIDVTEYANADFRVRFHYYNANWDWYWAIDNVHIHNNMGSKSDKSLSQYHILFDGDEVASTSNTNYIHGSSGEVLELGVEYQTQVFAEYSTGNSDTIDYTWTYALCDDFPGVNNMAVNFINGTNNMEISWDALENTSIINNVEYQIMGVQMYRDEEALAFVSQNEANQYIDVNVPIGVHNYCTEVVYSADNGLHQWESCSNQCIMNAEVPYPVQNVVAVEQDDNKVQVTWTNNGVEVEYRYDDGFYTGQLGFTGGTTNSVLGNAYLVDTQLSEMSWFLTSEQGHHDIITIYVLGLDENGWPDGSNVIFTESVTNTDLEWNTFVFDAPLQITGGFFLGIAYNGFVGLAYDDGINEPYIFENNTHFYNQDYTSDGWGTWESAGFPYNAMIRATGVEYAKCSYPEKMVFKEKASQDLFFTKNRSSEYSGIPGWKTKTINKNSKRLQAIMYIGWPIMMKVILSLWA